jgi:hypothetical protein
MVVPSMAFVAACGMALGGKYRFAGDGVKELAQNLREEIDRRSALTGQAD